MTVNNDVPRGGSAGGRGDRDQHQQGSMPAAAASGNLVGEVFDAGVKRGVGSGEPAKKSSAFAGAASATAHAGGAGANPGVIGGKRSASLRGTGGGAPVSTAGGGASRLAAGAASRGSVRSSGGRPERWFSGGNAAPVKSRNHRA